MSQNMQRYTSLNSKISQQSVNHSRFLSNPFFAGRDAAFLEAIIAELTIELKLPGDTIIEEGDPGDTMYFLNNGSAEVLIENGTKKVAELPSGSVFGEMCLLGIEKKRAATIKALELCDCRVVAMKPFRYLLSRFPHEEKYFAEVAMKRKDALEREKGPSSEEGSASKGSTPRKSMQAMQFLSRASAITKKGSMLNVFRKLDSDKSDRSSVSSVKSGRTASDPVRFGSTLSAPSAENDQVNRKMIKKTTSNLLQVEEEDEGLEAMSRCESTTSETWVDDLESFSKAASLKIVSRPGSASNEKRPGSPSYGKRPGSASNGKRPGSGSNGKSAIRSSFVYDAMEADTQSPSAARTRKTRPFLQQESNIDASETSNRSPSPLDRQISPGSVSTQTRSSDASRGFCNAVSANVQVAVSPEVEHLFFNLFSNGTESIRGDKRASRHRRNLLSDPGKQPIMLKKLNTTMTKPQVPNLETHWRRHRKSPGHRGEGQDRMTWNFEPENYPAAACGLLELPPLSQQGC